MAPPAVRSYRDLRVWQQAMDLAEAVYRATKAFPAEERYGLVSQMRRAAVSVASNIAEGHPRSLGNFLWFLSVASGSLTELETQLELSHRLGYLSPSQVEALMGEAASIGRMLSVLKKRLRGRRSQSGTPSP